MEFPITELLDQESSLEWLSYHFHPQGLRCPDCGRGVCEARAFRETACSQLTTYRCCGCERVYNLYTGTVFQGRHLTPQQIVLFLRGVSKGEPSTILAKELALSYPTVLTIRHQLQANGEREQPDTPLLDRHTETDEMFQNAGEKRGSASGPA
jgi:transposase-like protein